MDHLILYILTVSYCLAPEGKTVCEQRNDHYTFTEAEHCVVMRHHMVKYLDRDPKLILYKEKTRCRVVPLAVDRASFMIRASKEKAISYGEDRLEFFEDKHAD